MSIPRLKVEILGSAQHRTSTGGGFGKPETIYNNKHNKNKNKQKTKSQYVSNNIKNNLKNNLNHRKSLETILESKRKPFNNS